MLGLSWTGLPSRNLLTSSLVSLALLFLFSGGMADKKTSKNSSMAPERLVSPRDLKPTKRSSLKRMFSLALRMLKSIASTP